MSPPNSFSKNNLNDTTDNLKLPQLEMKRNVATKYNNIALDKMVIINLILCLE